MMMMRCDGSDDAMTSAIDDYDAIDGSDDVIRSMAVMMRSIRDDDTTNPSI